MQVPTGMWVIECRGWNTAPYWSDLRRITQPRQGSVCLSVKWEQCHILCENWVKDICVFSTQWWLHNCQYINATVIQALCSRLWVPGVELCPGAGGHDPDITILGVSRPSKWTVGQTNRSENGGSIAVQVTLCFITFQDEITDILPVKKCFLC